MVVGLQRIGIALEISLQFLRAITEARGFERVNPSRGAWRNRPLGEHRVRARVHEEPLGLRREPVAPQSAEAIGIQPDRLDRHLIDPQLGRLRQRREPLRQGRGGPAIHDPQDGGRRHGIVLIHQRPQDRLLPLERRKARRRERGAEEQGFEREAAQGR